MHLAAVVVTVGTGGAVAAVMMVTGALEVVGTIVVTVGDGDWGTGNWW